MNIKATFPAGVTALTVHGLHQWDYGRVLEISHPDLPAVAEVHFAAISSKEAIVHVVEGVNGAATVAIPNILLEQMSPITAWVYYVGETSGETMLTVTLPIQARPRPAASPSVPEEISDKYTEALGAINKQFETLKGGNVTVANAAHATSADRAKEAVSAQSAMFASQTTEASHAAAADNATNDKNGNDIAATYQKKDRGGFQPKLYFAPVDGRLYQFRVLIGSTYFFAVSSFVANHENVVGLGPGYVDGTLYHLALAIKADKSVAVYGYQADNGLGAEWTTFDIMFREI